MEGELLLDYVKPMIEVPTMSCIAEHATQSELIIIKKNLLPFTIS